MTKTSIQAYSLKTTGISCDDIRLWKNALFMYWQLRSEIGLILQQFCKFSVFGLCFISRVDATSHRRRLPAATLVHSDVARPPQRRGRRGTGGDRHPPPAFFSSLFSLCCSPLKNNVQWECYWFGLAEGKKRALFSLKYRAKMKKMSMFYKAFHIPFVAVFVLFLPSAVFPTRPLLPFFFHFVLLYF